MTDLRRYSLIGFAASFFGSFFFVLIAYLEFLEGTLPSLPREILATGSLGVILVGVGFSLAAIVIGIRKKAPLASAWWWYLLAAIVIAIPVCIVLWAFIELTFFTSW